VAQPIKVTKNVCPKMHPLDSLCKFSRILTLFHKFNVAIHDTEDKNVTHGIAVEIVSHFTPNEILH